MAPPKNKGDVTLTIGVDDTGVNPALSRTETSVRRFGRTAEQAGGGFRSLSDRLMDYRREETRQARSTRFFTAELAALLPVSQGVATAFGRLAGALSGGIGLGLGFEAVKLAAEVYTEHKRKAEEATKAAIEHAKNTAKITADIIRDFRNLRRELAGGIELSPADKALQKRLDESTEIVENANRDFREKLTERARLEYEVRRTVAEHRAAPSVNTKFAMLGAQRTLEDFDKSDLADYYATLAKAESIRVAAVLQRNSPEMKAAEAAAKEADKEEAALKRLEKFEVSLAQARAQTSIGLAKFDADMRLELIELARADWTPEQRKQLEDQIRAKYAQLKADALDVVNIESIKTRSLSKLDIRPIQPKTGNWRELSSEAVERRKDYEQETITKDILGNADAMNAALREREKMIKEFADRVQPLVRPMTDAFAGFFTDVLTTTKGAARAAEDAVRDMANGIVSALARMASEWAAMRIAMGIAGMFSGPASAMPTSASFSASPVGAWTVAGPDAYLPIARASGGLVERGRLYSIAEAGPEFVVNASATRRFRPMLEAMNAGSAPAVAPAALDVVVSSSNTCPSCQRQQMQSIASETVARESPRVIARDLGRPNSRTSSSLVRSHQTSRRR